MTVIEDSRCPMDVSASGPDGYASAWKWMVERELTWPT
jgi:hypothetical protein